MKHMSISKLIIIGSDNGLSPGKHQAIIWTNADTLLIGTLRTNPLFLPKLWMTQGLHGKHWDLSTEVTTSSMSTGMCKRDV